MTETQIAATALDESPNENISIPYGLIRTVRHYLEFVGVMRYIRGLKAKGIKLDCLILALAVFTMHSSNSMNACAAWLAEPKVKHQFGFSKKDKISQKTVNRAIDCLGKNREGIITALWEGIRKRFEIDDYDINLDGSAIVLYGPKAQMGAVGHPRDKNLGKMQVEFMVAQLAQLGVPIYIKPYRGNTSDEAQYRDCIPELAGLVSGQGLHALDRMKAEELPDPKEPGDSKKDGDADEEAQKALAAIAAVAMIGATIVADNGAASENNTARAAACGFGTITRMKLNKVDDEHIRDCKSEFVQLGDGMMCYVHRFKNGKANYLFFSKALFDLNRAKADARYEKNRKLREGLKSGDVKKSSLVKIRKVPGVQVDVRVTVQEELAPFSESERKMRIRQDILGPRCGFFKLRSDVYLPPAEVLRRYRRRAGIECVISSLKRITGIKPVRVWKDDSIAGGMMLALLCEAALAMARYCMKGRIVETVAEDGTVEKRAVKPNTESVVRSLNHLTLTWFRNGRGPFKPVLSNWEAISEDIFDTITAHESPDWGSRKVPLPTIPA